MTTPSAIPQARGFMRLAFSDVESAALAVSAIMAQPHTPSALEFLDAASLNLIRDNAAELTPLGNALLLIEVDGFASSLTRALAAIEAAIANPGASSACCSQIKNKVLNYGPQAKRFRQNYALSHLKKSMKT